MGNKRPRQAGGWHAVKYTFKMGKRAGGTIRLFRALRKQNTCKTCAFGMKGMKNELGKGFQVCKKAMQAQAQDMLKPIPASFFMENTVDDLKKIGPRELELAGRLVTPLHKPKGENRFFPVSWDKAFKTIVEKLRETSPEKTFFYVSGRSSNEAAFLLQIFARQLGTNNINNCSYYCHQASGVGLSKVFGTGTATIKLEDLEKSDLVMIAGANPSSNHPRFMTHMMNLRKRKGKIIVVNPFREVGLERFAIPSHFRSLLFGTEIANLYVQPHCGGDMAFFKAIAVKIHKLGRSDIKFLKNYCNNAEEFLEDLENEDIDKLLEYSGISEPELDKTVKYILEAKNPVFAWAMGLTHQKHGVETVQMLANLSLLIGAVGRKGSGLLPLRGHSNVQGVGTMGVVPKLKLQVIDAIAENLGIRVPEREGFDTFAAMKAAERGEIDVGFFLGGNLYGSNPASKWAEKALNNIKFTCQLSTTLNLGHLYGQGKEALILPVRTRDEEKQGTTQESMFNFVRYSVGGEKAADEKLPSETEIIIKLATELFGNEGGVDWKNMGDHDKIRELIGNIIPGMQQIKNVREHDFTIEGRIRHEPKFSTENGKANLFVLKPRDARPPKGKLNLMTFRSEGQFNTIIYDEEDVYRGSKHRNVVFISKEDLETVGAKNGDWVEIRSEVGRMRVEAVESPIKEGNVGMFFPEGNLLVPPQIDPLSKTPVFKKVLVTIQPNNTIQ